MAENLRNWKDDSPDLQTQLEELFNTVWKAEADWRLHDRIDLSLNADPGSGEAGERRA